jgi:hypothetical protein
VRKLGALRDDTEFNSGGLSRIHLPTVSDACKHQGAIRPAEAKRIFQSHIDYPITGYIGAVVKIAALASLIEVYGWRYNLMM